MGEQIPPATSYPTLGNSILPRTAKRYPDRVQADIGDGSTNYFTELAVPIMNQKLASMVKSKGFTHLLRDPWRNAFQRLASC
jgi:hypothetical protein